MDNFLSTVESVLNTVSGYVWGVPLLILLVGTHLYLTIRLRFIQRFLGYAIGLSLQRDRDAEGDISQFGALTTALAATIGTGNIVGVGTAVVMGGPGAIFWMWLTGVFGIATKYGEAVLAVKYRVKTPLGQMAGGPMYVLERGMNCRWLAVLFAAFTAIAAFGIGNMVQSNAVAVIMHDSLGVQPWISGLIMTVLVALVILGGIRSIARVCERLVPFMAIAYVFGCIIILIANAPLIPGAIALIVKSAFTGHAALGGFAGVGVMQAMRFGVARGLFSNESGLGSAPIVAAAAQTSNPVRQGLVSATGTFWDTVVICAVTGLVLVTCGDWMHAERDGAVLTRTAFAQIPWIGPSVLTFGLVTFVFSTILGWSYYGERAAEYLFGIKAIVPYRLLWVAFVMVGSVVSLNIVWPFADIANGLMAIPNLISLVVLSGVIVAETRKYLWDKETADADLSVTEV